MSAKGPPIGLAGYSAFDVQMYEQETTNIEIRSTMYDVLNKNQEPMYGET